MEATMETKHTPITDEIAARVRASMNDGRAAFNGITHEFEQLRADRDALKAQVAELRVALEACLKWTTSMPDEVIGRGTAALAFASAAKAQS